MKISLFTPPAEGKISSATHTQVRQNAQKGDTCLFYAMHMIRGRPNNNDKAASALRKSMTESYKKWNTVNCLMKNNNFVDICLKITRQQTKIPGFFLGSMTDPELRIPQPFIEKFNNQKQHNNFYDFMERMHDQERLALFSNFFKKNSTQTEKIFEEIKFFSGVDADSYRHILNISEKILSATIIANTTVREMYGLVTSDWSPHAGLKNLAEEIEKKGPIIFGGKFGVPFFEESSLERLENIEGRDVFQGHLTGIPKNIDLRMTENHAIVVLGMQVDEASSKADLYYVDPTDPSDPKNNVLRKIYKISFGDFKNRVVDIYHNPFSEFSISGAPYGIRAD